jgi:hypothetical protein
MRPLWSIGGRPVQEGDKSVRPARMPLWGRSPGTLQSRSNLFLRKARSGHKNLSENRQNYSPGHASPVSRLLRRGAAGYESLALIPEAMGEPSASYSSTTGAEGFDAKRIAFFERIAAAMAWVWPSGRQPIPAAERAALAIRVGRRRRRRGDWDRGTPPPTIKTIGRR